MLLHDNEVLSTITTENKGKIQKGNPHPSFNPNVARPTGPKDVWLHLLNLAFAQHITNRVRE
jgi:hypothetical protein